MTIMLRFCHAGGKSILTIQQGAEKPNYGSNGQLLPPMTKAFFPWDAKAEPLGMGDRSCPYKKKSWKVANYLYLFAGNQCRGEFLAIPYFSSRILSGMKNARQFKMFFIHCRLLKKKGTRHGQD